MVTENKPLTVYRASAGSGKTFTLATEYIKLLIKNPYCYNSILAVTFTNKATEEMKTRILSQLYGIWKGLDDSRSYRDVICRDLGVPEEKVRERAGTALQLLIHNYSYFRIETIDSFFQNILRNLARELDLTANMRLELSDMQVEEQAVNELIEELDSRNELLQWIISYINEKIADDKSWNVISSIKNFGQTIFKDFYKAESSLLNELIDTKGFFSGYVRKIAAERDGAAENIKEAAETFFAIMSSEGLSVKDLAFGSNGVGGFILKINAGDLNAKIGKRVTDSLEKPDKWYTKGSPYRERIHSLAADRFIPLLQTIVNERVRYKSAGLTMRHLYQLRLLSAIEKKIRELNDEAGRFLLSDTQHLLGSLIGTDDSPFIFEKIGAQLRHIMIDEFQDTSSVQWKNFKVLLLECMSNKETGNLIVGDVKQSIYRWRSGDWQLLNGIGSQFPHPAEQLTINTLKTNYRSQRNIISFNNAFFTTAVGVECGNIDKACQSPGNGYSEQLKEAYRDVAQTIPESRPDEGFVSVSLLPWDEYEECTLVETAAAVRRILACGYPADSIAVIVRNNKYIPLTAEYLSNEIPDIKIVSDEAFRLDASTAVNIIIMALRLLENPGDMLTKTSLAKAYRRHVLGSDIPDYTSMAVSEYADSMLPYDYTTSFDELRSMPLYDLAERIYSIFGLDTLTGQSAYVCAFYDHLSSFAQDGIPCIGFFLEEWDTSICGKTIQSSELTGVRLISIHKSKGLEYDNVIIPFCDWQIEKSTGNILWCKPDTPPYNGLPLIPVDYSSNLIGSIYEKDYFHEYLQNRVDNLNLLYVAFTRARCNLFVIGKRNGGNSRSPLIQASLPAVAAMLEGAELADDGNKDMPVSFTYGNLTDWHAEKAKSSFNVFTQKPDSQQINITSYGVRPEFRQSNQSRNFIGDGEAVSKQWEYIDKGRIMHTVFSRIRTADDIEKTLAQLTAEGVISAADTAGIDAMLRKRLADSRVADWFSGRWQLFNECTILSTDNTTGEVKERRPDRVMTDGSKVVVVDFKFGNPHDEYHSQVREYMELISAMGYENVEGYLWFVYSNKIEKV